MEKISITFSGFRITEPAAALTDIVVSVVYLLAFINLRKNRRLDLSGQSFSYFFVLLAAGTLLGGVFGHAFLHAVSVEWKLPGWLFGMIGVSFLSRAVLKESKPFLGEGINKSYEILILAQLVLFISLSIYYIDFLYVALHSAVSLLGVCLPLQIFMYRQTGNRANLHFISGIAVTSFAALIFASGVVLHKWFNHIALSHFVLGISAIYFYKASVSIFSEELIKKKA